jgi:hypothetical protein
MNSESTYSNSNLPNSNSNQVGSKNSGMTNWSNMNPSFNQNDSINVGPKKVQQSQSAPPNKKK